MSVIHPQGADRVGPCIESECKRLATVTGGGLWCQPHDLSISLEAELGTRELQEWLDAGAPNVDEPRPYNWEYPEPPVWSDDDLPYYRDDDEALS